MFDWSTFLPTAPLDVLEVAVLAFLIYWILRVVQGTIAASILRGTVVFGFLALVAATFLVRVFELEVLKQILTSVTGVLMIALVIVFQPELRRGLLSLGETRMFHRWRPERKRCEEELTKAVTSLVRERHGGLFAIERHTSLNDLAQSGVQLDSLASADLLASIFWTGAPLHDGGVILRDDRIVAAACIFPVTQRRDLGATTGTRHRAGIGLSEQADAVVVIVSEETGRVTVVVDGKMEPVEPAAALPEVLARHLDRIAEPNADTDSPAPGTDDDGGETLLEIERPATGIDTGDYKHDLGAESEEGKET